MTRLLFTFVAGFCSGLYCAQNYDTPDVKALLANLIKKARELEKQNRKQGDGEGGK